MITYEIIVKKYQDGAIFNLFITTEAKSEIFPAGYNKWRRCIEMKVCAPAKGNQANKDIIKTIANYFDKPVSNVFILSGSKKREKTIFVKDISINKVLDRLKESLDGL